MSRNDSMSLRLDTAKWFTVNSKTMFLLVLFSEFLQVHKYLVLELEKNPSI